jgi:hypothetical protein
VLRKLGLEFTKVHMARLAKHSYCLHGFMDDLRMAGERHSK